MNPEVVVVRRGSDGCFLAARLTENASTGKSRAREAVAGKGDFVLTKSGNVAGAVDAFRTFLTSPACAQLQIALGGTAH